MKTSLHNFLKVPQTRSTQSGTCLLRFCVGDTMSLHVTHGVYTGVTVSLRVNHGVYIGVTVLLHVTHGVYIGVTVSLHVTHGVYIGVTVSLHVTCTNGYPGRNRILTVGKSLSRTRSLTFWFSEKENPKKIQRTSRCRNHIRGTR